jgi:UPF0042 nucleotide-binding protein
LGKTETQELLAKVADLLEFSIPRFEREGKSYLTVAIGCTGGRHRSVVLAEKLAAELGRSLGRSIDVVHRDVEKVTLDERPGRGGGGED